MLEGHGVLFLEGHHHLVADAKKHQLRQGQDGGGGRCSKVTKGQMNGRKPKKAQKYLNCYDDDLEQLQNQLERLSTLGVILIAGAHEEVFQLPAQCFLFHRTPKPMAHRWRGEARVVVTVRMFVGLMVLLTAVAHQAVRTGRALGS